MFEQDDDDDDEEQQQQQAGHQPRAGSGGGGGASTKAQQFRSRLNEPQYGDASLTLAAVLYMLLRWKEQHCVRDTAFDELVK
jgi:hypothetical protein